MKNQCVICRGKGMLETLRRTEHRRYLFGIKRSTEANSWSWQKVFPFWKPKMWRKAVKYFMSMGFYGLGKPEGKGRLLLRTFFFLSLFLFSVLSFFIFCLFLSLFLPSQYDPRHNIKTQTYLRTSTPHNRTLHFFWSIPYRLTASGMPSFHSMWPDPVINCLRDWPLALTTYLS